MVLQGELNTYIRDMVKIMIKSKEANEFSQYCIINSILYGLGYNGILYTMDLSYKIDPSIAIYFTQSKIDEQEDYIENDFYYNPYNNPIQSHFYNIENERKDRVYYMEDVVPDLETMINGKVEDGSFKYIFPLPNGRYGFIILFKSIFNMNKGDTLSLEVYNTPYLGKYIAKFIKHKKKGNLNINIEFFFLSP